ncbi:hypothetical protein NDU88_003161 [Pleurodeles waltl]|uniref:Uncharacterized protein n=1 Tax=Pleurodeles waltl TaxID=8319 RepID=A0AAV7UXN9_PLEWA|nr:hypothetical protein NDU88_003161 [Pleurodeles waltl]
MAHVSHIRNQTRAPLEHETDYALSQLLRVMVINTAAVLLLLLQQDVTQDNYEEEDYLSYLYWDEKFYEAADSSIYRAVNELMGPMEQCASEKIAQECSEIE